MQNIIFNLFLSGLAFGSGPCLASCGPLLISYVAGTQKNPFKGAGAYFIFSLSRIAVYLIFAILIFVFGQVISERLGAYARYLYFAGGLFIVLVGILMMLGSRLELKVCQRLHERFFKQDKLTVCSLGLIVGALPCVPLLSVLSYIGLISKSWIESGTYALSFGAGTLLSPLFILVLLAGSLAKYLTSPVFKRLFVLLCGLILCISGGLLIARGI